MLPDPKEHPAIDEEEAYQLLKHAHLTSQTIEDVMRGAKHTATERMRHEFDSCDYRRSTIYEICNITDDMYHAGYGCIKVLTDSGARPVEKRELHDEIHNAAIQRGVEWCNDPDNWEDEDYHRSYQDYANDLLKAIGKE